MNYKDILYNLQDSFENHPYINVVMYSQLAVEAGNIAYPAILILPLTILSTKGMNEMIINLMGIDVYVDTDTVIEKLSSLIDAIKQSLNRFADTIEPFSYFKNVIFTPYVELYSDRTCGCSVTLTIDYTDDIAECYIKDCEEDC